MYTLCTVLAKTPHHPVRAPENHGSFTKRSVHGRSSFRHMCRIFYSCWNMASLHKTKTFSIFLLSFLSMQLSIWYAFGLFYGWRLFWKCAAIWVSHLWLCCPWTPALFTVSLYQLLSSAQRHLSDKDSWPRAALIYRGRDTYLESHLILCPCSKDNDSRLRPSAHELPSYRFWARVQVPGVWFSLWNVSYIQAESDWLSPYFIHATVAAPIDASCQVWCCCPLQFTLG